MSRPTTRRSYRNFLFKICVAHKNGTDGERAQKAGGCVVAFVARMTPMAVGLIYPVSEEEYASSQAPV